MSYFSAFPSVLYPFVLNGKTVLINVKDIALNVRIRTTVLNNLSFYDTYDIQDGETPEKISEKLYGDPNFHWVIMLANNRYDVQNDFPVSANTLQSYCERIYGEDKIYDPHILWGSVHYENANGNVVDGPAPGAKVISNYEHEFALNEKKRRIKVLNPAVISRITAELETIFENFVE